MQATPGPSGAAPITLDTTERTEATPCGTHSLTPEPNAHASRCPMEWVKLCAVPAYFHDGALLRAGEAAEVLFCRALAHCGSVESRGLVEKHVLPMLTATRSQARADALVREGLWLDQGTHYLIRSWDKWQDQHDVAAEKRRKDRERKRDYRRTQRDASADCPADNPRTKRDSHNVDVDRERERDREKIKPLVATPRKRPTPGTRMPDRWPLDSDHTDRLRQWAAEHVPAVALTPETANWRDWHLAKGDTAKDWDASWRTWMRRAQGDTDSRRGTPAHPRLNAAQQRTKDHADLLARIEAEEAAP